MFNALLLVQTGAALVVQFLGVGSAALFFLMAVPLFAALAVNPALTAGKSEISLVTYGIGSSSSVLTGTMLMLAVVEFFVPLVPFSPPDSFFPSALTVVLLCRPGGLGQTRRQTTSLRPS